jgi:hypothetical protein
MGPAMLLVWAAIEGFSSGDATWMRWLEMAIGAAFLFAWFMDWRSRKAAHGHPAHHHFGGLAVDWLELAGAGIFMMEAIHLWHRGNEAYARTGVYKPHMLPWVYGFLALIYVIRAFGEERIESMKGLHLDASGFRVRRRIFGRTSRVQWSTVRSHSVSPERNEILFHRVEGGEPVRVSFASYPNGKELCDRLADHAAQCDVAGESMQAS